METYAASEMGKAKDGGDDEPPPFRLHYPLHYALRTWADYHRHGLMPRPGGYDAQDPAWSADMDAITRRYNWHVRQLLNEPDAAERASGEPAFSGFLGDLGAISAVEQCEWEA